MFIYPIGNGATYRFVQRRLSSINSKQELWRSHQEIPATFADYDCQLHVECVVSIPVH